MDDVQRAFYAISFDRDFHAKKGTEFEQWFVRCLELRQLQDVFGYAPSVKGITTLAFEDIIPIIDDLAQQDPELGKEPVAPPSVDKLQRNALSDDVMELLRVGRLKEHLVSSYLAGKVKAETGEHIAEAFRQRYSDLKKQDHPPDIIFGHLQQYAGADGDPKRQTAALAVLSYFFEHCDIFEDPTDGEAAV